MNTNEHDAALGERLTSALRAEAQHVPVPDCAWERFAARAETGSAIVIEPDAAAPAVSAPSARRHPWRIPLIAAASVVAIAVATSAIATGGFGDDDANRTAAPAATVVTNAAGEVGVPFNASPDIYAVAPGSAGGAPASSLIESSADGAAAPQPTVWLKFTGGAPPAATLETRFQTPDKLQTFQYDPTRSNGTPLGYLAHSMSVHGGPPGPTPPGDVFLWGAVGPEVAQVQIVATVPGADQESEPAAGGSSAAVATAAPSSLASGSAGTAPGATSAHWTFDSGSGTAFSAAGSETATWTAMPDGYHAFAVHLSTDVESIDVIALGPRGDQLQIRRFDVSTDRLTDLPVPPTSTPGSAPSTTSTATSAPPLGTTATGSHDSEGTTSPGYNPSGQNAPATNGAVMATTAPSHAPATGRSAPAG